MWMHVALHSGTQSGKKSLSKKHKQINYEAKTTTTTEPDARDHFTSSTFFVAKNSLRRPKIREETVAAQIFDFMSKWQFCENSHPSPRKILLTCSTFISVPMVPCIATVLRYFHSHCVQFSETKRNEFDWFSKRFIFKYPSLSCSVCRWVMPHRLPIWMRYKFDACVQLSSMASRRRREVKWLIANNNWINCKHFSLSLSLSQHLPATVRFFQAFSQQQLPAIRIHILFKSTQVAEKSSFRLSHFARSAAPAKIKFIRIKTALWNCCANSELGSTSLAAVGPYTTVMSLLVYCLPTIPNANRKWEWVRAREDAAVGESVRALFLLDSLPVHSDSCIVCIICYRCHSVVSFPSYTIYVVYGAL